MNKGYQNDETTDMPFIEHLSELRSCLAIAITGIGVASLLCFGFSSALFAYVTAPLIASFDKAQLIGTAPAEAFITKLKVSIGAGLILASPISFSQVWRFISPGMHKQEKKYAIPFVLISTACFITGVLFCYYGVLPFAFIFFSGEYSSIGVSPQIRIGEYLSFCLKLLIVFGNSF